jgi:D-proline reductase (dithiol) PrdB
MDIVSHCGVPRYLFNDLPLGNPLGKPYDTAMQAESLRLALALVASATAPVVQQTRFQWSADQTWRDNYMRVDDSNREALRLAGEANRLARQRNKELGLTRKP